MERRILFLFLLFRLARSDGAGRRRAAGTAPTRARPSQCRGFFRISHFGVSGSPRARAETASAPHGQRQRKRPRAPRGRGKTRRAERPHRTGHKGHTGSAHGHAGGAVTRCVQAGVRSECRRDAPRPGPAGGGSRLPPCDARIRLPLRITCSWVPVPISFRRIHAIECAHMDILLAAACLSRLSPFSHWLEISFPGRRGWQVRAPRARPRRVNS